MAPTFRLVRLLHQRQYSNSLENIDALLGCGVTFPEIDPDLGLDEFGTEDSRKIINSLFYTINWFREVISAFVTQKGHSFRLKVLKRITNVIELEEKMTNFCKMLPDHKFPISHFHNVDVNMSTIASTTVDSEKPKRKKVNMNVSRASTQGGSTQTQAKSSRKPSKEKDVPRHYRELDTDIILLLKLPLLFEDESDSKEITLTIPQFIFIMQDLVGKLQTLSSNTSNLSHLTKTSKPEDLFNDCIKLMPFINGHLIHIEKNIQELLDRCDGIHDAQEMFCEKSSLLKKSLSVILEIISYVFSWPGLHDNLPLLKDSLKTLLPTEKQKLMAASDLMLDVISRLTPTVEYCLTLSSAVAVINIIKAFCSTTFSNSNQLKKKLRLLSGKFLERKWFTLDGLPESGAAANLAMNNLIIAHLDGSDINEIRHIVDYLHDEVPKLNAKDDYLSSFNGINKFNFPMLYRAICSFLLEASNNELKKGKLIFINNRRWVIVNDSEVQEIFSDLPLQK